MKKKLKTFFWCFQLEIPFEIEESFLWKLETLGIQSFAIEFSPDKPSLKKISIWLHSSDWSNKDQIELNNSLLPLAKVFGLTLSSPIWQKVHEEDWSISWKKHWKPDPVGNNLLILPAWLETPKNHLKRKIIRIDPGSAFGTGTHPSTRLCLEALEKDPPIGLSVADLGCGSGILGLTALRLGAKKILAVDIDSLAISSTKKNYELNDFADDSLVVSKGSIEILSKQLKGELFDLLLCNILAPVIKELVPGFDDILKLDGRALLSGILVDQIEDLSLVLAEHGWKISTSSDKSNWSLIEIHRI